MIVCSAIKSCTGEIISGRRHADCIRTMAESGKYKLPVTKDAIQGFLDDKGNFLDRLEARKHFLESGQVSAYSKMHHSSHRLIIQTQTITVEDLSPVLQGQPLKPSHCFIS
jgi:hypothetical protein